jgi:hypothetical protein
MGCGEGKNTPGFVRLRYCGAQHTDFAAKGQTDCSVGRKGVAWIDRLP